jgi:hypothetical protein
MLAKAQMSEPVRLGGRRTTDALPPNTAFFVPPLYGFTFQVEQNAALPTPANYVLRIFASDGTEVSSGTYAQNDTSGMTQQEQPNAEHPLQQLRAKPRRMGA